MSSLGYVTADNINRKLTNWHELVTVKRKKEEERNRQKENLRACVLVCVTFLHIYIMVHSVASGAPENGKLELVFGTQRQ